METYEIDFSPVRSLKSKIPLGCYYTNIGQQKMSPFQNVQSVPLNENRKPKTENRKQIFFLMARPQMVFRVKGYFIYITKKLKGVNGSAIEKKELIMRLPNTWNKKTTALVLATIEVCF